MGLNSVRCCREWSGKRSRPSSTKHLDTVNEAALKLLKVAIKNIMTLGNAVKNCIADYDKPHRDLLQNWKEIEQHSDKPIREWMTAVYTKIYNFIMLEQVVLKKEE